MHTMKDKAAEYIARLYGSPQELEVQARKHVGREMDTATLDLAVKAMGSFDAVYQEAQKQLRAMAEDEAPLRDGDGVINTGLLDLSKFGLTAEQIDACVARRRQHGIESTLIIAQTALGDHFETAAQHLGSTAAVVEKFYDQMQDLRQKRRPIRFHDADKTVRVGCYSLNDFGLDDKVVAELEEKNRATDRRKQEEIDLRGGEEFRERNKAWSQRFGGGGTPGGATNSPGYGIY